MNHDEIINLALKELRDSEKVYKSFQEFSFMNGLHPNDSKFIKIRYMLVRSEPFEKHSDGAIKLSATGIKISNDFKDWFDYKKSLVPKKDYFKYISISIALLSFIWNVYQGFKNDELKKENLDLKRKLILIKPQLPDK